MAAISLTRLYLRNHEMDGLLVGDSKYTESWCDL